MTGSWELSIDDAALTLHELYGGTVSVWGHSEDGSIEVNADNAEKIATDNILPGFEAEQVDVHTTIFVREGADERAGETEEDLDEWEWDADMTDEEIEEIEREAELLVDEMVAEVRAKDRAGGPEVGR